MYEIKLHNKFNYEVTSHYSILITITVLNDEQNEQNTSVIKENTIKEILKNVKDIKLSQSKKTNKIDVLFKASDGNTLIRIEKNSLEIKNMKWPTYSTLNDTYNDISIELTNGITQYAENNKKLLHLETSDKMALLPNNDIDKNSSKN
ncbi:hypothetical protein PIROE2DRAFT_14235 [Piromyces sp. E2]|nr:hypothetical protein PIROE2DRAFT_14235 [Piromyces sp. E2]|eukprot:OUM60076.1 hypothetical protein PIROE2DRAFT_14235 [Piromyces sp. E2]